MADKHGIREGKRVVPPYEEPVWKIDVTDIGTSDGAVSSPTMKICNANPRNSDLSSSLLSGSMSVSSQEITLKKVLGTSMTLGDLYWILVTFAKDGGTHGVEMWVECKYREDSSE